MMISTPDNADLWPEEEWERLEPYLEFSQEELGEIAKTMLGREDVVKSEILTGGKCNTNIEVGFSDATRVVIRIYERDKSACRRDEVILSSLATKVPVARMLAARYPSEPFGGAVGAKLEGRPVAIFEWVDGVKPFEVFERGEDVVDKISYGLGKTLVAIKGARRFSHHGLLDEELGYRRRFSSHRASFVDFMQWSLTEGRAGQRLPKEMVERLERFVEGHASMLDEVEGSCGLVHGDYKLSNILVGPVGDQWEVRGVLDWEFALAGTPLFDIAILMRHADRWPGFAEGFARGFVEAGGVLPEEWRRIAQILDLMNLCGFLNGSDKREKTFSAVQSLIDETIRTP